MTLARSWVKDQILPAGHSGEINSSDGRTQNGSRESDVEEFMTMLNGLRITEGVQQKFGDTALLGADADTITEWFDVKYSANVQEGGNMGCF